MNLRGILQNKAKIDAEYQPLILNLAKISHKKILTKLFKQNKIQHVVDDYTEQLKELFQINNPSLVFSPNFESYFENYIKKNNKKLFIFQGRWVFFSWNSTLVHILSENDFFKVRTARNRNLISEAEQQKFYNAVVGIAGLSVGNSAALAIVLQGGAKHIKLADHDKLALSNTNRIRTSLANLGSLKIQMTARQIYEINPYSKVEIFANGITETNVNNFCNGLNIIVDEVDNLSAKYLLREQAKKRKLPVLMAADNGDNGIVDIERYDLNPKLAFFHGRMGEITYKDLIALNKFNTGRMIVKHLGLQNISQRTYESFLEMGKTLVSWPQLGGAALLNGSVVAYVVRKIANNQLVENNRAIISLDKILTVKYDSPNKVKERMQTSNKFKKILGL